MAEVATGILGVYNAAVPSFAAPFVNLFILVLLIVIYAVFVWKFYRFIARKNFLGLDLRKYNQSESPFMTKLLAGILYLIEYIIVLPFLIFFWYGVFTFLLLILSQSGEVQQILVISAAIIASVRIISYYKEQIADEVAKFLPLTLLATSILNPNTFTQTQYLSRIINHLSTIPSFLGDIANYLIFIIIIEIILRFFDFIFSLFGFEDEATEEVQEE